ncbi:MAG: hypothetical protein FWF53_05690 [Candidatus Azobacteroides sp.]|nr:hypothetical protein [Candidatus Azobacteroides sp.]
MKQKVIIVFTGTDCNPLDLQDSIDKYLKEGWKIKKISTAYLDRAGVGMSVAVTLLLGK